MCTSPQQRMVEVEAYNDQGNDHHDEDKDDPRKHIWVESLQSSKWYMRVWNVQNPHILPEHINDVQQSKAGIINSTWCVCVCDLQSRWRWARESGKMPRKQRRSGCGDQDADAASPWRAPALPSQTWTPYLRTQFLQCSYINYLK